jgi:hypothetical protein
MRWHWSATSDPQKDAYWIWPHWRYRRSSGSLRPFMEQGGLEEDLNLP